MRIHRDSIGFFITVSFIAISGFTSSTQGDSVVVGEWTDWSSWSDCTRPCGLGISERTRQCKAGTSVNGARGRIRFECEGDSLEYSTCNTEKNNITEESQNASISTTACSTPADFRAQQCSAFNKKEFHGKTYVWKPYLTSRPCELSCKARGQSFYVKLANKVEDGTPCSNEPGAVCVNGNCRAVGCDGVLGSNKVRDKCGVCGGRGNTCKLVNGLFSKTDLPYGYNEITILPRGACNINVTELEYSRNYLALKVVASGKFIFNSNWRIDYNGEFKSAGTLFKYMRPSNRYKPYNEHVLAKGPLSEAVSLLVLYQQKNPGIVYEYTIPGASYSGVVATSPEHRTSEKTISNGRTLEEPKAKGGKTLVDDSYEAVRPRSGSQVAETSKPTQRPTRHHRTRENRHQTQQPNVDPVIRQEASQRAGAGTLAQQRGRLYQISADIAARVQSQNQSPARTYGSPSTTTTSSGRRYVNAQVIPSGRWNGASPTSGGNSRSEYDSSGRGGGGPRSDNGRGGGVSRTYGGAESRPYDRRGGQDYSQTSYGGSREVDSYGSPYSPRYEWRVSGFTECSKTCGGGVQNSRVICVVRSSLAVVTDENCSPSRKPRPQTITCNNNACPARWVAGSWGGCTVTCGKGSRRRRVECRQSGANNADLSVSASRCAGVPKPATVESCDMADCFKWKIGQWGQCSVRCGRGTQRRDVYCANHEERKVRDENCKDLNQPEREQACQMKPCNSGWMYSAWLDQCSADCGSGFYVRDVLCASRSGCNQDNKPGLKRSCGDGAKCGGQWFTGPWSPECYVIPQCADTCETSEQSRSVVCMMSREGRIAPLDEKSCDAGGKPESRQQCETKQCTAKWYMTQWSECSATCGEAYRTRVVQCLSKDQRVATTCDREQRPPTKRNCDEVACPTPPPLDPGCRDLMSRCMMVVRARLCTYKYYKQRCCHSCTRYEDILKRRQQRNKQQRKRYSS